VFLICLGFVYLVLAAQYESFILPLAVILSLPAEFFGAFIFAKNSRFKEQHYLCTSGDGYAYWFIR
jgi:multidrug efflux pump subunit AcrB